METSESTHRERSVRPVDSRLRSDRCNFDLVKNMPIYIQDPTIQTVQRSGKLFVITIRRTHDFSQTKYLNLHKQTAKGKK